MTPEGRSKVQERKWTKKLLNLNANLNKYDKIYIHNLDLGSNMIFELNLKILIARMCKPWVGHRGQVLAESPIHFWVYLDWILLRHPRWIAGRWERMADEGRPAWLAERTQGWKVRLVKYAEMMEVSFLSTTHYDTEPNSNTLSDHKSMSRRISKER